MAPLTCRRQKPVGIFDLVPVPHCPQPASHQIQCIPFPKWLGNPSLYCSCHHLCTQVGDQRGDHLKMVLNGLHPRRYREHTYGQGWGRGEKGWDKWREQHGCIYTTICKQTANGNLLYDSGNSHWNSNNLEGWEWMGGGRETQDGEDICTPMVNSCWCMTEIKLIL